MNKITELLKTRSGIRTVLQAVWILLDLFDGKFDGNIDLLKRKEEDK